jgi:hypothetical protein
MESAGVIGETGLIFDGEKEGGDDGISSSYRQAADRAAGPLKRAGLEVALR